MLKRLAVVVRVAAGLPALVAGLVAFASPGRVEADVSSVREDGAVKTLIDSLALRIEGGLFEYTKSPPEAETKFSSPDEITLFVARPLLPELSVFVEIGGEPNAVVFEKGRYFTRGEVGLGKEAFFMLNLGRFFGSLGAPTMEMGGQTMVGKHGALALTATTRAPTFWRPSSRGRSIAVGREASGLGPTSPTPITPGRAGRT